MLVSIVLFSGVFALSLNDCINVCDWKVTAKTTTKTFAVDDSEFLFVVWVSPKVCAEHLHICKLWQELLQTDGDERAASVIQYEWTVQHYLQVDKGLFYHFLKLLYCNTKTHTHRQTQPQGWDQYDLMPLGKIFFKLNSMSCSSPTLSPSSNLMMHTLWVNASQIYKSFSAAHSPWRWPLNRSGVF